MFLKFSVFLGVFICLAKAQAASQDFFGEMLAPADRPFSRVRYEIRQFAQENAGGEKFGLQQNRFDLSVPLKTAELYSWRAKIFADYDAIESKARFSTGRPLPNRLWDAGAGISHSRKLENANTIGGSLSVSSATERPFQASRDMGYTLNLTYKIPEANESAWFLFLNSSNTRGFANYIPLPGFAYYFRAHEKVRMLVGIAFAMVFWTPADLWSITAFYFPLRNAELRVTYGKPQGIQPYALVSYRTYNFRLSDRSDADERLYEEEGLTQAGLSFHLNRGLHADLSGGLNFARRYYLATKMSQRSDAGTPTIKTDNAPFAALKLVAAF